jgi:hypothetical protein
MLEIKDVSEDFPKQCEGGISHTIPESWYPAVRHAMEQIVSIAPDIHFDQVKGKFSGLRVYVSFPTELSPETKAKINTIIQLAELEVSKIEKARR